MKPWLTALAMADLLAGARMGEGAVVTERPPDNCTFPPCPWEQPSDDDRM